MSEQLSDAGSIMATAEGDLLRQATAVISWRRDAGLEGLVGGLDAVIISTEQHNLLPAADAILRTTGHSCRDMYADRTARTCACTRDGSASIVLHTRTQGANPFSPFNMAPVAKRLRNTRLETFVFTCQDITDYVAIQRGRGIRFLTQEPVPLQDGLFIQTAPSRFTGNSLGFVEWHRGRHSYRPSGDVMESTVLVKPPLPYTANIGKVDHAATRVRAQERNAAILEFLSLTNYYYDFAVYVRSLNSITSVARLGEGEFAMVFTSGITSDTGDSASSGPTEAFIRNYGTRVHHIAFHTDEIESTVADLGMGGQQFLLDLVGSREEGLKQIFTVPSPDTLLVTEYIHRFDGFDGFFTKGNVERLTAATGNQ